MACCTLYPIDPTALTSCDLRAEAAKHPGEPGLEAYQVLIDGQAERAEVLYFGTLDIAGVAWGADASWLEHMRSAEEACTHEFGDL